MKRIFIILTAILTFSISNAQVPDVFPDGIVLGSFASDPTGVKEGQLYYNTTNDVVMFYNGTTWSELGSSFDLNGTNLTDSSLITLDRTIVETGSNIINIGNVDNDINLKGLGTRPTYNLNQLALLSDVSNTVSFGTQYQIPFVNATTDDFDYASTFVYNTAGAYPQLSLGVGDYSIENNSGAHIYYDSSEEEMFAFDNKLSYDIGSGFTERLKWSGVTNTAWLDFSNVTSGQILDMSLIGTGGGGISNVVEDTTPQLGGDLDINGNDITDTSLITVDRSIVQTSAGLINFGNADNSINLRGDLTRPRYNSLEIGLLSDVFSASADYSVSGSWNFLSPVTFDDNIDMSGTDIIGLADPTSNDQPVTLGYFNNNVPSNDIATVIVADSTYTFLEADLLASKPHILTNTVADTLTVTIPDVTKTDSTLIFASLKSIEDKPIKIIPSDSANQVQYIIKDNDEAVGIASYLENEWFKWRNVTSSAYSAPAPPFDSGLILNGTFDDATNITLETANWVISGGVASYDGLANSKMTMGLSGSLSAVPYTVTFDASNTSGNFSIEWFFNNGGGLVQKEFVTYSSGDGSYTYNVTLVGVADEFQIRGRTSGVVDIDNVSLTAD